LRGVGRRDAPRPGRLPRQRRHALDRAANGTNICDAAGGNAASGSAGGSGSRTRYAAGARAPLATRAGAAGSSAAQPGADLLLVGREAGGAQVSGGRRGGLRSSALPRVIGPRPPEVKTAPKGAPKMDHPKVALMAYD